MARPNVVRGHGEENSRHLLTAFDHDRGAVLGQLAALPWRDVPVAYTKRERGHGRAERRTLKVTKVAAGLAFPHAALAIKIVRRRKVRGTWSGETCHAVTSLTVTQASYAQLAAIIRGHCGIEDRLHWVTWTSTKRSQVRTAHHGQPAQPGHHHPAAGRGGQPRRRPALARTPTQPAPSDDHEVLNDSAGGTGPAAHSGWMPAARRAAAVTGLALAPHATSQ
jgi:hypothetical protein